MKTLAKPPYGDSWFEYHESQRTIRAANEAAREHERARPRCTGRCSCTSACGMKAGHPGDCSCAPDAAKSGCDPEWKHGDPRTPPVAAVAFVWNGDY